MASDWMTASATHLHKHSANAHLLPLPLPPKPPPAQWLPSRIRPTFSSLRSLRLLHLQACCLRPRSSAAALGRRQCAPMQPPHRRLRHLRHLLPCSRRVGFVRFLFLTSASFGSSVGTVFAAGCASEQCAPAAQASGSPPCLSAALDGLREWPMAPCHDLAAPQISPLILLATRQDPFGIPCPAPLLTMASMHPSSVDC